MFLYSKHLSSISRIRLRARHTHIHSNSYIHTGVFYVDGKKNGSKYINYARLQTKKKQTTTMMLWQWQKRSISDIYNDSGAHMHTHTKHLSAFKEQPKPMNKLLFTKEIHATTYKCTLTECFQEQQTKMFVLHVYDARGSLMSSHSRSIIVIVVDRLAERKCTTVGHTGGQHRSDCKCSFSIVWLF